MRGVQATTEEIGTCSGAGINGVTGQFRDLGAGVAGVTQEHGAGWVSAGGSRGAGVFSAWEG